MAQSMATLTQSKYYSPSLNGAIFDGPFKIYFSQSQESLGLTVYFQIQKKLGQLYKDVKKSFSHGGSNVFIMLYPSQLDFNQVFPENISGIEESNLNGNNVIAVCAELLGEEFDELYSKIKLTVDLEPDPLIA